MSEKIVNSAASEKAPTISAMEAKKESVKANLRDQRDKDREMVKGIFKFY